MKIERQISTIGMATVKLTIDWPDSEPRNRQYLIDDKEVTDVHFRDVMTLISLRPFR